jgi:hypothetical protein
MSEPKAIRVEQVPTTPEWRATISRNLAIGRHAANHAGAFEVCNDARCIAARQPVEPSVPLSAIRALVQQWREHAEDTRSHLSADFKGAMLILADELAALCPAPPEDQTPQG